MVGGSSVHTENGAGTGASWSCTQILLADYLLDWTAVARGTSCGSVAAHMLLVEGSNRSPISVGPFWLKLCYRGGDAFEV